MHYFAADGNYGDATDLVIVQTSDWTTEDWDIIMDCNDTDRKKVAESIANAKKTIRLLGL